MEEQRENQLAASKARKQKMMLLEMEKKKQVPPTETELEKQAEDDFIRTRVLFVYFWGVLLVK